MLAALALIVPIEEGLRRGADWATEFAANYASETKKPRKTGEVDVLLGLHVAGFPHIRTGLIRELAGLGLSLRMGWVYCHQSPIIGWTDASGTHGCELGDLLIVVTSSAGKRVARRALLVQFKISGGTYGLTDAQGRLYKEWPAFRYTKPNRPTWRRSVHPKKPHRGAQIGLFQRCHRCGEPHGQMRCDIPGENGVPLAREIEALLLGGGGRELRDFPEVRRKQGWDRMIWDLVHETTRATLNYHGYTYKRRDLDRAALAAARQFGVALVNTPDGMPGLMIQTSPYSDATPDSLERRDEGPPPQLPRERFEPSSSGAISTVFIDVAESHDQGTPHKLAR